MCKILVRIISRNLNKENWIAFFKPQRNRIMENGLLFCVNKILPSVYKSLAHWVSKESMRQ